MNSQDFNNEAVNTNTTESLLTGITWFYAQFITGDIDEQEFSDLVDLHIELNHCVAA